MFINLKCFLIFDECFEEGGGLLTRPIRKVSPPSFFLDMGKMVMFNISYIFIITVKNGMIVMFNISFSPPPPLFHPCPSDKESGRVLEDPTPWWTTIPYMYHYTTVSEGPKNNWFYLGKSPKCGWVGWSKTQTFSEISIIQ